MRDDGNSGQINNQKEVTITGTNDNQDSNANDLEGAVTETVGTPAAAATLSFFVTSSIRHTSYIGDWSSDVCSSDLGTTLGSLTAVKDSDTTGTGTGGQLTWTYSVNASAVEYLAKDQTKVESFTITLDRKSTGLNSRHRCITYTVISEKTDITAQDLAGAVTETV